MLIRFKIVFILTVIVFLILTGCNATVRKLIEAEKAFDSGDYETAQFKYFELISTTNDDNKDKIIDSYYVRVQKLVTGSTYDPASYPEWATLLDAMPEKKASLDSLFTKSLLMRAESLLKEGETVESAVLIGYIPEGQDDQGMTEKIAQEHEKKQEQTFNNGFEAYKKHEYEKAIETWKTLDMTSEWGKKAEEITQKIPAEKEEFYLLEAKKRKVEGLIITAAGPINRVIFNRIQGRTLETESASDGRQFLRIEATLTKDIELYAWYKDGENYKSLGGLRREFVWLEAEDPEKIKKMYKQVITADNPAQVIYFLDTEYDFYKYHPVFISTEMIPRNADDINEIAIVQVFK